MIRIDDLDRKAIDYFLKSSAKRRRLESLPADADTETVLKNLRLLTENGKLKYAALLMFAKEPQMYFPAVRFKIGRFGSTASDLMFDDVIEGNILEMTDRVMQILSSKYLISPIHYEGIQRVEKLEIPEDVLREMICNAIVHKDYQSVTIQMKVYNDRVMLWNPGNLPEDLPIERLFSEHHSHARNPNIAHAFYRAGLIEAWGRGIEKICEGLASASLHAPKFEQVEGGINVTVMRNMTFQNAQAPNKHRTSSEQVPEQVVRLLEVLGEKSMSVKELMQNLNLTHRPNFIYGYLKPAIELGLIQPLFPEQPRHPKQKYQLRK